MMASCSTSLPICRALTTSGTRLVMRIKKREAKAAETCVKTLPDRKFLRYCHQNQRLILVDLLHLSLDSRHQSSDTC